MSTRTKPSFEMVASKDGRLSYSLVGKNMEILLVGMSREFLSEVVGDILDIMTCGGDDNHYKRGESASNTHWFQLVSPKGNVLGVSVGYHSRIGRDNGIIQVRRAISCYMPNYLN